MSRETAPGGEISRHIYGAGLRNTAPRQKNAAVREMVGQARPVREIDLVAEQSEVRSIAERITALFRK